MTKSVETANVHTAEAANFKCGESKSLQIGVQNALYTCAYEGQTTKSSSTPAEQDRKPTDKEMVEIKHEAKDVAKGKWGAQSIKQFEHAFNEASKEPGASAHNIADKMQWRIDRLNKELTKEGVTNRAKLDVHYNKDTGKAEYDVYMDDGDTVAVTASKIATGKSHFPNYDRLLGPSVIRVGLFQNDVTKYEFVHPGGNLIPKTDPQSTPG
jgi:hypothetical protein